MRSAATTRNCVISSAFSSTSTAASLVAEALVGEERLAVRLLERGELLDAADARLGKADARDAGALVAEQEFGIVPALVLLADEVLGRHLTSSKNTSLTSWPPSMVWIGRTVMPGVFMSIRRKEMPSCFFAAGSVRTRQKIQSAILRQRRPGFLAVDDVVVAVALRRGLQRREIGAGAGLGEPLAPPVVEIGDARQEALFLRLVAKGDDAPDRPC